MSEKEFRERALTLNYTEEEIDEILEDHARNAAEGMALPLEVYLIEKPTTFP